MHHKHPCNCQTHLCNILVVGQKSDFSTDKSNQNHCLKLAIEKDSQLLEPLLQIEIWILSVSSPTLWLHPQLYTVAFLHHLKLFWQACEHFHESVKILFKSNLGPFLFFESLVWWRQILWQVFSLMAHIYSHTFFNKTLFKSAPISSPKKIPNSTCALETCFIFFRSLHLFVTGFLGGFILIEIYQA